MILNKCAIPPQTLYRHKLAVTVAVALVPIWFGLLFFRFLLEVSSFDYLWYDNFDSRLILWIFERNFLSLKNQPLTEFWNANQFYPVQGSLAFSDSIIAGQIIYFPMRLVGFSPLESLYITFFCIIFIASYLIVWVASEFLNFDILTWIIFCFICQFSLTATTFLNHYQLFAFQFATPFFLLLYSIVIYPTGAKLIGITVLFITICSFSTYFAPMSLSIVIFVIAAVAAFNLSRTKVALQTLIRDKYAVITSVVLLAIFFYIQILPYIEILSGLAPQSMIETSTYSAKVLSLVNAPSLSSVTYKADQINGYWEYSYFPGFVILLGAIYGVYRLAEQKSGDARILAIYMVSLFVVVYVLSLGPYLNVSLNTTTFKIPLPFYLLTKILPGVENIRAPGRYGAFLTLPLAYFFIASVRLKANVKKNLAFLVAILILLVYDARVTGKLHQFNSESTSFFDKVASEIEYRDPTLILPLHGNTHFDTIQNYISQLHVSNHTGAWVVAGYGAKSTDTLAKYTDLSRQVSLNNLELESLFCAAREDGIVNILLLKDTASLSQEKLEICKYRLVVDYEGELLYRFTQ